GNATKQVLIKLNASLANLTRSSQYEDALHLFLQIHSSHPLKPDVYTLSTTLTACANLRNSSFGNQLHAYAIRAGLKVYPHVANTILSLYKNTQDLVSVKRVFREIEKPDVYSWTTLLSACTKMDDIQYACELFDKMHKRELAVYNAMITGCVENGYKDAGIRLFREMHKLNVRHDNYSFASVLSVCDAGLEELGRQVHALVIKTRFLFRVSVVNALITMYFNCRNVVHACMVFKEAKDYVCDHISYNVMMDGLASVGRVDEVLMMFREMLEASLRPSEVTFVSVMSACLCARVGCQLHAQAIKSGFEAYTSVSNAAMTMYSTCGDLDAADMIFERLEEKDIVSWNTMISSYAQRNLSRSAILAYLHMRRVGMQPDEFTFGSLLACSKFLEMVEMIHPLVIRNGIISNIQVSNALVSAYAKYERVKQAYQIFNDMSPRNTISWNTMISGFLLNCFPVEGLKLFSELLMSELRPDVYTLSIALSICASISSLRHGKQVHGYIMRSNLFSTTSLGNALITMYAKCGELTCSLRVFNEMIEKDTVSWNAIISAYAQHGKGNEAVSCFEAMQNEGGVKPDQTSFAAVLSACSHAGLVDDGSRIFDSMVNDYGFIPGEGHLSCILDLLGRAGYLEEAGRVINSQHIQAHSGIWWALFSACAAHGNLRLGRIIAGLLLEREQQ
ncbi:Pentatricopeptide repeat-containing protein, partial [Melia azedarach]